MNRFFLLVLIVALLLCAPVANAQQVAPHNSRFHREASTVVKWNVWGDASFSRAKKENRPVFLSIGYVSSNACHLMQREAFSDIEVAKVLNAEFVPILVDEQEYPEVAAAYGLALRHLGGGQNVPANLILTPELAPFAGAGFLRTEALLTLLQAQLVEWRARPAATRMAAQAVVDALRKSTAPGLPLALDESSLGTVIDSVAATWDSKRGGFGSEPKLTSPMTLSFLFAYAHQKRHDALRGVAIDTLRRIAASPVHDQLGGGFHRGSVVGDWSLPYFEKLLPDQALMTIALTEAWQLSRDERLANVARATIEYTLRDLKTEGGAFWSAQDAYNFIPAIGPQKANGAFYVWNREELRRVFGDKSDLVFRMYGMVEGGNVARGVDPALTGQNLLWAVDPGLVEAHNAEMKPMLEKILKWRQGRPGPFRDDKFVTGWNGLMISALARAGAALDEPAYVDAAVKAANATVSRAWNARTRGLLRTGRIQATPADYSLLIGGLLDLFEATQDPRWYELAGTLQGRQDELFWNATAMRYQDERAVPASMHGVLWTSEPVVPSANSSAAGNLLRLGALSGEAAWRERASMIFRSLGRPLTSDGASMPQLANAFTRSLATPRQVALVGRDSEQSRTLLRAVHGAYVPLRAVVMVPVKGPARERTLKLFPSLRDLQPDPERPQVYVCVSGRCESPTAEPAALLRLLN